MNIVTLLNAISIFINMFLVTILIYLMRKINKSVEKATKPSLYDLINKISTLVNDLTKTFYDYGVQNEYDKQDIYKRLADLEESNNDKN